MNRNLSHQKPSLLLLGFGFTNWYLRLLLFMLHGVRTRRNRSFALDPEEYDAAGDSEGATGLYFDEHHKLRIVSMDVAAFCKRLAERVNKTTESPATASRPLRTPGRRSARVFISYCREDADYATNLRATLGAAGLEVWMDTADIRPGQEWNPEIEERIREWANYFVLVVSDHLRGREKGYIFNEITIATEVRRRIRNGLTWVIPVHVTPGAQCPEFNAFNWYDMPDPRNAERIIEAIREDRERRQNSAVVGGPAG